LPTVTRATDRIPPNGIDGAVLLLGNHNAPDAAVKRFVELAGGAKAKLVLVAPASARTDSEQIEKIQREWAARKPASVVVLNWNDPKLPPALTDATGVWLRDDRVAPEALLEVRKRGGIVAATAFNANRLRLLPGADVRVTEKLTN